MWGSAPSEHKFTPHYHHDIFMIDPFMRTCPSSVGEESHLLAQTHASLWENDYKYYDDMLLLIHPPRRTCPSSPCEVSHFVSGNSHLIGWDDYNGAYTHEDLPIQLMWGIAPSEHKFTPCCAKMMFITHSFMRTCQPSACEAVLFLSINSHLIMIILCSSFTH